MTPHYISSDAYSSHFFSDDVRKAVSSLVDVLAGKGKINVFPDATVKNNSMPNGLALIMPWQETILFPFLLRDPGCGFLTFMMSAPSVTNSTWAQSVGQRLDTLINHEFPSGNMQKQILQNVSLQDILLNGLTAISHLIETPSRYVNMKFDVDAEAIKLTDDEEKKLTQDLMTLTNTLEIRKISYSQDDAFQKDSFIGFVHSGCEVFPNILAKRFIYNIANYADSNGLATVDQIKAGRLGVRMCSDLGYEYVQWIKSAMNYALVSRTLIYLSVKKCLSEIFHVETDLLNDVTHAGVFEQGIDKRYTVSTRGVQPLFSQKNQSHQQVRLIAGQKESVALMVRGINNHEHENNWIQHGTSYNMPSAEMVNAFFKKDEAKSYINAAQESYCNTTMNIDLALPYSFNALAAQEDQKNKGLIEPLAILTPCINVHGQALLRCDI